MCPLWLKFTNQKCMGLSKYTEKRSFSQTPEPKGKKSKTGNVLRFVIQKHAASHLHYDFRLEMEGVLKSWAVPKGPSTDPDVKRLAMMVEDHPYDYRNFEGIIPPGNYGAGTVIVWDEGTYEPVEKPGEKQRDEKQLLSQLHAGKLHFVLHGEKLHGEFALVKTSARGENAWLLMKLKDKFASRADVTKKALSVKSGLSLEEVAEKSPQKKKVSAKKTRAEKEETTAEPEAEKGKKSPAPTQIKPMLATLTEAAFDSPDWLYEIKWDGYRALSWLNGKKVRMISRNDLPFNKKFPAIAEALSQLNLKAVFDGEIVALDAKGHSDFQRLQNFAQKGKPVELAYYVFDLLWYNGRDLRALPLVERKNILHGILPKKLDTIRYSDHIRGDGTAFFRASTDAGLEGIMAKRMDSRYVSNVRSQNWLKVKNNRRLEAVICGYTKPRNGRKHFGALVLGKYEGNRLKYIGHSGSGFDEKKLGEMYKMFQRLVTDECPFAPEPKTNAPVTWLKPELVCEIKFSEMTDEGIMRQPIFVGLREDKTARDEKNEKVVPPPTEKPAKTSKSKMKHDAFLSADEKEVQQKVGKHMLTFTNLDKLYFPKDGISKRDVLNYYEAVSGYMMPYMKNRPQSLNRHPNGIGKPNFYQKDVQGKVPDRMPTFFYDSESGGGMEYLVCTDKSVLLYMANLGCIEMNPWHGRIQSPESPDWCVIDLDPDGNPFDQVVETALMVKQVLDSVKVPCYCKTSGASGMHIFIPMGARYGYAESKTLAELIVTLVHEQLPGFTSLVRTPAKRKGKIYLDFLQNGKTQTIVAPYSLRPVPGAQVSMPLEWHEVKKGLSPKHFTIHNALERIPQIDAIFKPVLGKGINLQAVLKRIEKL